jgi:TM2 domain-containing membrane protein YozV
MALFLHRIEAAWAISRRMPFCPSCGASVASGAAFCGACGKPVAASGPSAPVAAISPPPATQVHVHVSPALPVGEKPISSGMAVAALLLNVLLWPGLGSLVAGEPVGWAQGFLNLLGLILVFTIIGIFIGVPLMIAMWIWGLVTGIQLVNRASAQQRAAGFS